MQAGHRARWRVAFTKVTHPLFHSLEEVVSKAFAAAISRGLALPPPNAAPATPLERWLARSDRFGLFEPPRSRSRGSAPKSRRRQRHKRLVVEQPPDHHKLSHATAVPGTTVLNALRPLPTPVSSTNQ